jgi:hypothetical protein
MYSLNVTLLAVVPQIKSTVAAIDSQASLAVFKGGGAIDFFGKRATNC